MEHYFSEKPTSKFKLGEISFNFADRTFKFYTAPSVFSKSRVDLGSAFMITTAKIKEGWRVLDLGCGYGVVGIILKVLFPKAEVWLSDINERAVKLARMNAVLNDVDVNVVKSFSFDNLNQYFNAIFFNPPQAAGLDICYRMIADAYDHLMKEGYLYVVARHNKGGSRFEQKMMLLFGNVTSIRGHKHFSKYTVYVSQKQDGSRVSRIADKFLNF